MEQEIASCHILTAVSPAVLWLMAAAKVGPVHRAGTDEALLGHCDHGMAIPPQGLAEDSQPCHSWLQAMDWASQALTRLETAGKDV